MSAKRLIVNADDYGRTPRVSAGIRLAHLQGIVTSTTAMLNMPSAAEDLRRLQTECPALGVGVHLVLTAGRPLRPPETVSKLIRPDGSFPSATELPWLFERLDPQELRDEWRAQIEAALSGGVPIDHLDSHHHVCFLDPRALEVALELAREYDLAMRYPLCPLSLEAPPVGVTAQMLSAVERFAPPLLAAYPVRYPQRLIGSFYAERATLDHLLALLEALPDGAVELMCHPGYSDDELQRTSSYSVSREVELAALTSPLARAAIARYGITLIPFARL